MNFLCHLDVFFFMILRLIFDPLLENVPYRHLFCGVLKILLRRKWQSDVHVHPELIVDRRSRMSHTYAYCTYP